MTKPDDLSNGRTHEPGLRELTAQLDDLKELMQVEIRSVREVMAERDKRYESQFKNSETSVGAALAAADKQTTAAFLSSEKAIVKAEEAQRSYNATHNELSRKMDDQYKIMMPRVESEKMFDRFKEDIQSLRESRSESGGRHGGYHAGWSYLIGGIGLLAVLGSLVVQLIHR